MSRYIWSNWKIALSNFNCRTAFRCDQMTLFYDCNISISLYHNQSIDRNVSPNQGTFLEFVLIAKSFAFNLISIETGLINECKATVNNERKDWDFELNLILENDEKKNGNSIDKIAHWCMITIRWNVIYKQFDWLSNSTTGFQFYQIKFTSTCNLPKYINNNHINLSNLEILLKWTTIKNSSKIVNKNA